MKGIILAGGSGTRLFPNTLVTSKQLLPVYDKPTIYYPLSVLMLAGIKEILIISTPRDLPLIENLFKDGSHLGLKLKYKVQEKPDGIAKAFVLGERFIEDSSVSLILGDNLFYGHDVTKQVVEASELEKGACVFAYHVNTPERYGVVEFDGIGKAISIEEKPKVAKSNWAVTGLYFYDKHVSEYTKQLKPSARGELEITDLNRFYMNKGELQVRKFGRGVAWLDTGSADSLLESAQFVQTIEKRQGQKIACLEEIALARGYIDISHLRDLVKTYPDSEYGVYVKRLAEKGFIE